MADGAHSSAASLAQAHQRMLADHALQFSYRAVPPPKPPDWLKWLEPLSRFLNDAAPVFLYLLVAAIVIALCVTLFLIVREIVRTTWPERFGGTKGPRLEPEAWRPTEAEARALLEDVDQLAAQGRFAEAVRLLLHRSIQDIHGKRPNLVRPALTSRDISTLTALPEQARAAFSAIARVVERSHFGGAPVDAAAFAECRRTYEAFAFPEVWA